MSFFLPMFIVALLYFVGVWKLIAWVERRAADRIRRPGYITDRDRHRRR